MRRIAWHPEARRELFEASSFYESESSGLGELFLDAVEAGLDRLAEHPRSGREIERSARRYLVRRFPYGLVYRLDASDEIIFVLAVAHLKRRPVYWSGRL